MNQLKCYQPELNPSQLFVNFDGFPVSCFHGFGVARRPASADVTTTRRRKTKDLCLGGKKNRQPVQRLIEIAVKSCCIFGSEKHIFVSFVSHIIFQLQRLVRLICDYIETILWNYISESNMWCIVYILDMNRYDIFANNIDIFGPWRELIETPSLRAVLQPRRCFWQHTPWKKQRQRCRISKVRNDLTIWNFAQFVGSNWRMFQITLKVQTQVHFAKTQQKSPK